MANQLNPLDLANCLLACISTPSISSVLIATAVTGSLSFLSIGSIDPSSKLRLAVIYLHMASFLFLIATLSVSMACGMLFLNLLLPAVPILLFAGIAIAYFLGPRFYMSSLGAHETQDERLNGWIADYSKLMGIEKPALYVTEQASPVAFSAHGIKPRVCISRLVLERLSPEEVKAILIHEIAHIMMKTQIHKVFLSFLRFLTPFSLIHSFQGDLQPTESRANGYVKAIQGTSAFVDSAADKVTEFYS